MKERNLQEDCRTARSNSFYKELIPKRILLLIMGLSIIIFSGCKLFKPKTIQRQAQFIEGTFNRKNIVFNNQVKGTYNKEKHRLSLRAFDTSFNANTLVLNIELGKDSTLDLLKFPRLYSSQTDTFPKRQISYGSMHLDNAEEEKLYENYTFRHWSDLKITLLSFSKDSLLQGTFSGSLLQNRKRIRMQNGRFSVYVKGM